MKKKLLIITLLVVLMLMCNIFVACKDGEQTTSSPSPTASLPDVHTHSYGEWQTVTPASCDAEGSKKKLCACGDEVTESISKLSHSYGEWQTVKPVSCDTEGSKKKVCACGNEVTEVVPASHAYGDWQWLTENGNGYNIGVCAHCSTEVKVSVTGGLSYNGGTVTGIGSAPSSDKIVIPYVNENNVKVTSIGNYAFYYCSKLTSITIPASITGIGSSAFEGCSGLTSVYISDIAAWCEISFGDNPLHYAENLYLNGELVTELAIPNGVTCIADFAFYGYSKLTSITIPSSVTSIDNDAFNGCSGLTSITIPSSVITIGDRAFDGCSGLTGKLVIPDSVTSIGEDAFSDCSSLTSITFQGVTSIDAYAFEGCNGLTRVNISDIVAWCKISFGGDYSNPLHYARNLYLNGELVTELVIPSGVTSIGKYTFDGCRGLTSITIPEGVTSIGEDAFLLCGGLTSVYISDIAAWCKISFYNANSNPLCYAPNIYINGELVTDELIIPEGVTSIGSYAFYNYSFTFKKKGLTIPSSVTSIGNDAFYGSIGLINVNISDIAAWSEISFGNRYSNPLHYAENLYLNGELVTELAIPNGVTSISDFAFYGYSKLTSITIPSSVTSIGNDAFNGCSGLTSITIPSSVISIGNDAFNGCSTLTIYCEAESKPSGWSDYWNYYDYPVVWDYKV